jgi:signal peptidase I
MTEKIRTDIPSATVPEEPAEHPHGPSFLHDLVMLLRWLIGMVLVQVCCGWGLFALVSFVLYKSGYNLTRGDYTIEGILVGVVSLAFFFAVEYKHLLSRFMGLRMFSHDPYGVKSALYLWVLGMPGLLFRSTQAADAEEEPAPYAARPEPQQPDGFREIVETIVFVVVLVLLLRSFAAEAFVIPTGSMAETLYGYQRLVTCPECGFEFPVNCSNEVDPQEGKPTRVDGCVCPNCRKPLHFPNATSHPPDSVEIPDPGWNSGDRVLVAKFLYEMFEKRPNRLDVVVFKFPGDSPTPFPHSGPVRNHAAMNYIKRLVGLPGETIAIYRGRIYALPPGSGVEFDDWKEAQGDPEKMMMLWQQQHQHSNESDMRKARELFDLGPPDKDGEPGKFTILRKSPETMLAMRRPVYDNDHQAKDLKGVLPSRWSGAGWEENGTTFKTTGGGDATEWLRYGHILRTYNRDFDPKKGATPVRSLITDFMAYNYYEPHPFKHSENWVGDLMLECDVTVDKPEGEFVLELSKSHDRFRLQWNLATGEMDVYRDTTSQGSTKEEKLASKQVTKPKAGSTYRLRFANFDDRLTVWLDNSLPFGDGVEYKGLRDPHPGAGPVKENDLEPASVGSKGAAVTVKHLSLWRNTYYTVGDKPTFGDAGRTPNFADPLDWGVLHDTAPMKFMYVQPEHYLCLGDNSPESSDGRTWGLVPDRLLLGRAMLVYYPFGRTERIR